MKRLKSVPIFTILFLLFSISVYAQEFDYTNREFQATVNMLWMEGHGNDDLATCLVKQQYYKEVAEMMENGMNKDEIIEYYVSELGEEALKAPLKKGFSLTAWVLPFVALIAAAILILILIRKWSKSKKNIKQEITTEEKDDVEDDVLTAMIEEERKKYF